MIKIKIIAFGFGLFAVLAGTGLAFGQEPSAEEREALAARAAERKASAARAYTSCVSLAENSPSRAISVALNWRDSGGGTPASHCLALALAAQGDYDEAAREFSNAAEMLRFSGPGTDADAGEIRLFVADLLGQSGNAWLLADETVKAYDIFSQALSDISPSSMTAGEIYVDRARASFALGDFEGSLSDLNKALLVYPNRADIMVFLASSLRALERFDEAQITIVNALAITPDDEAALLERGNVRLNLGDLEGARKDWARILLLYPNSVTAQMARRNIQALDGFAPDDED